jgi:hypothetical protein
MNGRQETNTSTKPLGDKKLSRTTQFDVPWYCMWIDIHFISSGVVLSMQQRSCLLNSILGRIYRRFVRQGFSVPVLVTHLWSLRKQESRISLFQHQPISHLWCCNGQHWKDVLAQQMFTSWLWMLWILFKFGKLGGQQIDQDLRVNLANLEEKFGWRRIPWTNKQTWFPKTQPEWSWKFGRLISLSLSRMLKMDIRIEPRHCKLSQRIPWNTYKFQ